MRFNRATFHFLFQTYEGAIDRRTWSAGTLVLAAILLVLVAIWLLIAPATHRTLPTPELFDIATLGAFVYLAIFAFAVILIAVSWTNLSAKRFRAVGRPGAFAAALPFAALVDGAAHWFQPRAMDIMPAWTLVIIDLAMAAIALWSFYQLGRAYAADPVESNRPPA